VDVVAVLVDDVAAASPDSLLFSECQFERRKGHTEELEEP